MPTNPPKPIERDLCMYRRVLHVNRITGRATYGECQCPDIPCPSCSAPTNYHEFFRCEGCEREFCLACLPVYEPRKMRFCPKCADEAKRWDNIEDSGCPYCGERGGEPRTIHSREFQGDEAHGGFVEWEEERCSRCAPAHERSAA